MSAAAAPTADAPPPAAKKKLSKKLLLILALAVLLLAGAGVGALLWVKHQQAQAALAEEGGDDETTQAVAHDDEAEKTPPSFLPLEPFVVNLADREQERYAQVGVTLEVADAKAVEQLKLYMPAIRNGVLMVLAHKTSAELLERAGKERLAAEIMREAARPLGIELPAPQAAVVEGEAASAPPRKKKKPAPEVPNPIRRVHFSSFIIQ